MIVAVVDLQLPAPSTTHRSAFIILLLLNWPQSHAITVEGNTRSHMHRCAAGKVTFWARSPLARVCFSQKSPSPRATFYQNHPHQGSLFGDFNKICKNKGHFSKISATKVTFVWQFLLLLSVLTKNPFHQESLLRDTQKSPPLGVTFHLTQGKGCWRFSCTPVLK